jgi:hypothetical protein
MSVRARLIVAGQHEKRRLDGPDEPAVRAIAEAGLVKGSGETRPAAFGGFSGDVSAILPILRTG